MPRKSHGTQAEETQRIALYKWEFLRRNPEYRKDYEEFIAEFGPWFREHGYWYDQKVTWDRKQFEFFAKVIAPKMRAICQRWQIVEPLPPTCKFPRSGFRWYNTVSPVLLPTDCSKESAGKLFDLSVFLMSDDEFEKKLADYEASKYRRPPDHQLATRFDLRRPLSVLVRQATELLKDRKRRYDRKYPVTKTTRTIRRRLNRYDRYLRIWDLKQSGEKFEFIAALLFPSDPQEARLQRAKDSFNRAQELIDGGYQELR